MITLEKVSKYYGETCAVQDLSMEIEDGKICILLGLSGCGKSTTLRMINKLIPTSAGEIFVNGKNVNDYVPEDLRQGMGYVVQSIGLFPHFTVKDNISVVPKLLKHEQERIDARVDEMLKLVGLDPSVYGKKYPHELSGGEAQRVGVARALAANPPILLMDEPFGAVDPMGRKRLQTEFQKIQKELRKTVVFVTHDVEEAIRLGDKIAIMNKGHLEEYDTPEGIIIHSQNKFVRDFLGSEYAIKVLSRISVSQLMVDECIDEDITVLSNDNIQSALSMMIEAGKENISVADEDGTKVGAISIDAVVQALKNLEE